MNELVAAIVTLLSVTACSTVPTEHQLIGTWMAPEIWTEERGVTTSHSKQMVDLTLRADHTFLWSLRGRHEAGTGHWSLRGRWLTFVFTSREEGHKVGHPYRDKIIKLSAEELVYIQGEEDPDVEVHLTKRLSEPLTGAKIYFR
jgi:hypothetical protein